MSTTGSLLVEIVHPRTSEFFRFACGDDFEVLRTGHGGRDIYGKRHEGHEYLFFPLSFKPVDAGVLALGMPASYEEHPFGEGLHGARIRFKAAHGTPFFPEMPEEYWSDTGVLHIDASGIRVRLDKLDRVRDARTGLNCGCNDQDHGGQPVPECGCHGHGEQPAPQCACGHHGQAASPARGEERAAMDERELAEAIRRKAAELNSLLELAAAAGLLVELGTDAPARPEKVVVRRILLPL